MNTKRKLFAMLLLFIGAVVQLSAQSAVTVGSQVTSVDNIVSGKAYVLKTGNAYISDNGSNYDVLNNGGTSTERTVYYLIDNGDGTWKIKNYYTKKYWSAPTTIGADISSVDESSAGSWTLNFSGEVAYPRAMGTTQILGLERSNQKMQGWVDGSGNPSTGANAKVYIYEVGPTEKGIKPIEIVSGWYLMKWVDTNSDTNTEYSDADVSGKFIRNYAQDVTVNNNSYPLYLGDAPTGTDGIANSLVYFERTGNDPARGVDGYLRSTNGHYITQTGAASNSKTSKNYIIYRSSVTPYYSVVTSGYTGNRYSLIPRGKDETPYLGQTAQNKFPVGEIYSVDFSLYGIQPWSVEFDGEEGAQVTYSGSNIYGLTSVYNGGTFFFTIGVTPAASDFTASTRWGFSPDIEVDEANHTIKVTYIDSHKVYTINNTNTNRGAIIYNPSASTKYVWSSGKSGTFDPSSVNSQWVFIPAETSGQFYLYNVGAGKFAIPTNIAQGANYSWVFSDNAVAVILEPQNDGTKKIKMATNPVSGTNAAYMAISNNYTGPVINYNDAGGNFTITLVDGQDQSAAANAAVDKLVKSQTPLTTYPSTSGWYAIQIKSKTGSASYAGRFLQNSTTLYNNLYPLTFTGGVDVQPAITDPTFITYINCTSWDVNTWQLPDGRYLVSNSSSKFPTTSTTAGNVICGYDNGNYFKSSANYYADPYNSNANYFIGETTYMRTAYTVYPIDLNAAGLAAWKVVCDNAPESSKITCSRNDVRGLSAVYKNGYFFLPADVTPLETDFALEGASEITIDETDKTISIAYDPNLALVEGSVRVEQGWQTVGRDNEVMLLRVTASPFKAATNVSMKVNLKDGAEANISEMKLYEANSNSPEIYSTGSGAPTKTEISTAAISGSTATFNIGDLSEGTHYYWIGATASSNATIGSIVDAAVTGITYTCNSNVTELDLTNVGDPEDRGAMVFNAHSYPFLPRDNGSRVYRIPAMVVADDGSIVVACDKRYQSHTDIGAGHVIDIVVRRSTDGGKTWSEPITIAKGLGTADDSKCGYGDPSLVKGKDGKLYCLFVAGNVGYWYGEQRIAMSTSTDNGVTWSSDETTPPVDLWESGRLKNWNTVGGYGLFDYFVTSGRGLYIPEDDILMYLIPAQTMTSATEHTGNSQDYVFYSTDGGESWYFSENIMYQGGDEAKIIKMNDGSLLGSVRSANRGFNTATYTKNNDGTLSFTMGTQWTNNQLNTGAVNNQDIYYYQRETVTGKKDIIIHSVTRGNHANFKLCYSTDQGANWTEFLTVQTKGTRYVTMERSGSEENPGSLYLFFEDQSLNSAGGYTDFNHYPLNFVEITREQLESLIPGLNDYNVPEYLTEKTVKNTVYGTSTGCDSYGALSGTGSGHWARTWTSNASSGVAGLTVSTESGYGFDRATLLGTRVMTVKPSANGATDTYTISAPEGYVIKDYAIGGAVYTSGTYRITAEDGTTTGDFSSTTTPTNIEVKDVYAPSTTFTFYGASQSNWCAITNFTISLAKPLALNVVGSSSYATLYVPFDVTTMGNTKAYYIQTADNGSAQLTETNNNGTEIPANTAVVLVNEDADASTLLNMTTGLAPVIDQDANLLKGTLVPRTLDLSDNTTYYSLGKKNDKIGFYKFEKGGSSIINLAANKAYLDTPAVPQARGFVFDFDDPTGIGSIQGSEFTKLNDGVVYDLSGRRVDSLKSGIYIVNGKKIIK